MRNFDYTFENIKLPCEIEYAYSSVRTLIIKLHLIYIAKHIGYDFSLSKENYDSLKGKPGLFDKNINLIQPSEFFKLNMNNKKLVSQITCDMIWFNHQLSSVNIFEVKHSDAILNSLLVFKKISIKSNTKYVIVAPDEDRDKVVKEANNPQFHDLNTRFFSYSAVEELYALCQKRKLKGVTEEFLDCYMEPVLMN